MIKRVAAGVANQMHRNKQCQLFSCLHYRWMQIHETMSKYKMKFLRVGWNCLTWLCQNLTCLLKFADKERLITTVWFEEVSFIWYTLWRSHLISIMLCQWSVNFVSVQPVCELFFLFKNACWIHEFVVSCKPTWLSTALHDSMIKCNLFMRCNQIQIESLKYDRVVLLYFIITVKSKRPVGFC